MIEKLKNIANIQMGYSFRSRLERDSSGNAYVIQMKDLTDDFKVDLKNTIQIKFDDIKGQYRLVTGDIIFRTRGLDTTACIIDEEIENILLAAPLIRIRANKKEILPEYLQWYINQSPAQSFLNSRAKGTAQKMINKQSIEELEIEIPTLEKQNQIIELASLSNREQALLSDLAKMKDQYISTILINSIKEK